MKQTSTLAVLAAIDSLGTLKATPHTPCFT